MERFRIKLKGNPNMTTKQKQEMYQQIEKHGNDVLAIFPNSKIKDPVKLYKSLKRLETKGHSLTEQYCNGDIDGVDYTVAIQDITTKLHKLLGIIEGRHDVFCNSDPRGYCLKVYDEWLKAQDKPLYRDFGGYGILAPDFSYQYQK